MAAAVDAVGRTGNQGGDEGTDREFTFLVGPGHNIGG
jgi:hypothetical protein